MIQAASAKVEAERAAIAATKCGGIAADTIFFLRDGHRYGSTQNLQVQQADRDERAAKDSSGSSHMNSVTEVRAECKLKEHVGGYFSNQWPVASVYRGDGACEERADPSATPRDDKPVEEAKRSPVGTTAKSRSPLREG